ncbi:MAG: hypothetical protein AAF843_01430 [Bacteroidota bacterium]
MTKAQIDIQSEVIIDYCLNDLEETHKFLRVIDSENYTRKISLLSNASFGQHIRHILEFYGCLLHNQQEQYINYDSRVRSLVLESNTEAACSYIVNLQDLLRENFTNDTVHLISNFSRTEDALESIKTNMLRELAYCLEHSIHHKALIKVGLLSIGKGHLVESDFGVAASTIRNHAISSD